jgi:hypothetical protein
MMGHASHEAIRNLVSHVSLALNISPRSPESQENPENLVGNISPRNPETPKSLVSLVESTSPESPESLVSLGILRILSLKDPSTYLRVRPNHSLRSRSRSKSVNATSARNRSNRNVKLGRTNTSTIRPR